MYVKIVRVIGKSGSTLGNFMSFSEHLRERGWDLFAHKVIDKICNFKFVEVW